MGEFLSSEEEKQAALAFITSLYELSKEKR